MSDSKSSSRPPNDWSDLLTDPDLVGQIGLLLQTYRDSPPERREQALLEAMREIKSKAAQAPAASPAPAATQAAASGAAAAAPAPVQQPPFEPDLFAPTRGQDRRRYPRMKCFVAVELRVNDADTPIWGNLANTSVGGCYVETLTPVENGTKLELGLWVNNGKIWVKGVALNGVVIKSNPCFGLRIKFTDMERPERETLRFFLRFVESTTQGYESEHGYLARLKK